MVLIRQANEQDIDGIIDVKRSVWPDEGVDAALMRRVVLESGHVTQVAVIDDRVVGFVDGFNTSSDGILQWNLDLIAVHTAFQGQGIATALMRSNTIVGQNSGAERARGLVATENVASQRTFKRCGYVCDPIICGLYVNGDFQDEMISPVWNADLSKYIVPVMTLNYCGCWVEDEWTDAVFEMALARWEADTIVGAVIPMTSDSGIKAARAHHLSLMGHYQWWRLEFKENAIR